MTRDKVVVLSAALLILNGARGQGDLDLRTSQQVKAKLNARIGMRPAKRWRFRCNRQPR